MTICIHNGLRAPPTAANRHRCFGRSPLLAARGGGAARIRLPRGSRALQVSPRVATVPAQRPAPASLETHAVRGLPRHSQYGKVSRPSAPIGLAGRLRPQFRIPQCPRLRAHPDCSLPPRGNIRSQGLRTVSRGIRLEPEPGEGPERWVPEVLVRLDPQDHGGAEVRVGNARNSRTESQAGGLAVAYAGDQGHRPRRSQRARLTSHTGQMPSSSPAGTRSGN